MPGRPCLICAHPGRADMEAALAAGASFGEVAAAHGVSKAGLHRHQQARAARVVEAPAESVEVAEVVVPPPAPPLRPCACPFGLNRRQVASAMRIAFAPVMRCPNCGLPDEGSVVVIAA